MTLVVNGVTFTVSNGQTVTSATVVNDGEIYVTSGGTIVDTVVGDSSVALIEVGGTAAATTLANNGFQDVYGTANSTVVEPGGAEYVFGASFGAVVAGGVQYVGNSYAPYSDGTVVDDQGTEVVYVSGVAAVTEVNSGGTQTVDAGGLAVGTTLSGGSETVELGGTTSGTVIYEGTLLMSGGVASGTVVGSGLFVASGGTASNTTVDRGGTFQVSDGGVARGVTVDRGGTLEVLAGGTVSGAKLYGGTLTLSGGAVFEEYTRLTMMRAAELILGRDSLDSFQGTIRDFGGQDSIDLTTLRFTAATTETFTKAIGASGVLQVENGSRVADLNFAGTYTTANLALQSDGAHGSLVTFVP